MSSLSSATGGVCAAGCVGSAATSAVSATAATPSINPSLNPCLPFIGLLMGILPWFFLPAQVLHGFYWPPAPGEPGRSQQRGASRNCGGYQGKVQLRLR